MNPLVLLSGLVTIFFALSWSVYAGNPAPLYDGPVHLGGGSAYRTSPKQTRPKPTPKSQVTQRGQTQTEVQTVKAPAQEYTTMTVKTLTGRVVTYSIPYMR